MRVLILKITEIVTSIQVQSVCLKDLKRIPTNPIRPYSGPIRWTKLKKTSVLIKTFYSSVRLPFSTVFIWWQVNIHVPAKLSKSRFYKLFLYSFESVDMSDIKVLSDAVNVFEFGADIGYKQNLQCIRIMKFLRQSFYKTKQSRAFVDDGGSQYIPWKRTLMYIMTP
jgi:hypothetical protein